MKMYAISTLVIILALTVESTYGACTPGADNCMTCDGDNCETCDNGYAVNSGGTCVACGDGCTTCAYNSATPPVLECSICSATYVLNANKTCTACSTIADCTACTYSTGETPVLQCSTCGSDKQPSVDKTKCVFACNNEVANCAECANAADACSTCSSGFGLNGGSTCIACDDANCDTCPASKATCTKCKDGTENPTGDCPSTDNENGDMRLSLSFLLLCFSVLLSAGKMII